MSQFYLENYSVQIDGFWLGMTLTNSGREAAFREQLRKFGKLLQLSEKVCGWGEGGGTHIMPTWDASTKTSNN